MKPDVPVALAKVAQALLVQVGPWIANDYAQRSALVASLLLQSAAEEWDRAAARRVEENEALRTLFRESAGVVADGALGQRLVAATGEADDDLHIGALDRRNDALRALLIELHAHVETLAGDAARRVEAAIWDELRRSTERRRLSVSPF